MTATAQTAAGGLPRVSGDGPGMIPEMLGYAVAAPCERGWTPCERGWTLSKHCSLVLRPGMDRWQMLPRASGDGPLVVEKPA